MKRGLVAYCLLAALLSLGSSYAQQSDLKPRTRQDRGLLGRVASFKDDTYQLLSRPSRQKQKLWMCDYECTYDRQGLELSVNSGSHCNSFAHRNSYDTVGRLLKVEEKSDFEGESTESYQYSQDGCEAIHQYNSATHPSKVARYDTKGRLITVLHSILEDGGKKLLGYYVRERIVYRDDAEPCSSVKTIYANPKGSIEERIHCTYDKAGRVLSEDAYPRGRSLPSRRDRHLYDQAGNLLQSLSISEGGMLSWSRYTYNNKGLRIEADHWRGTCSQEGAKGYLSAKDFPHRAFKEVKMLPEPSYRHEYKDYDTQGNWRLRITYRKGEHEPHETLERTIKYHP